MIKTILVPTDFSKTADNAADYAASIASYANARIILLHVYQPPVYLPEAMVVFSTSDLEEDYMKILNLKAESLHAKYNLPLDIECRCTLGLPASEINDTAESCQADMIVLGMQGAGYIREKLIGSITTSVARKTKRPVLVVGEHVSFQNIKHILLTVDYDHLETDPDYTVLIDLARLFNASVSILNIVVKPEDTFSVEKTAGKIRTSALLNGIRYTFHYRTDNDIVEGINRYVSENNIDMVAMIPQEHSFFDTVFHASSTKKMAFHTAVPLLAMH